MKKVFLITFILLCAGCTAKHSMRTTHPQVSLQWPHVPNKAKVTYVESVQGFAVSGGSGSVFRAIAGNSKSENDLFLMPVAVATGSDGRIAVADMQRQCVHLYVPAKNRYTRITGYESHRMQSPVGVGF